MEPYINHLVEAYTAYENGGVTAIGKDDALGCPATPSAEREALALWLRNWAARRCQQPEIVSFAEDLNGIEHYRDQAHDLLAAGFCLVCGHYLREN